MQWTGRWFGFADKDTKRLHVRFRVWPKSHGRQILLRDLEYFADPRSIGIVKQGREMPWGKLRHSAQKRRIEPKMIRSVIALLLAGAGMQAQVAVPPTGNAGESPNPVVQWNRNLLASVRTPGAQPATIHPTRSFAMMHAAYL